MGGFCENGRLERDHPKTSTSAAATVGEHLPSSSGSWESIRGCYANTGKNIPVRVSECCWWSPNYNLMEVSTKFLSRRLIRNTFFILVHFGRQSFQRLRGCVPLDSRRLRFYNLSSATLNMFKPLSIQTHPHSDTVQKKGWIRGWITNTISVDFNKMFEWWHRLTGHTCYILLMYEILHQLIGIWVNDFQRLEHLSNSVVGFVELVLCSLKFAVNVFFFNDILCDSW